MELHKRTSYTRRDWRSVQSVSRVRGIIAQFASLAIVAKRVRWRAFATCKNNVTGSNLYSFPVLCSMIQHLCNRPKGMSLRAANSCSLYTVK